MSLGVLNNLNAVYAENSLNNTSNSRSKVLNQLSSGSKINSGGDDAAGLSLVDGLQANSMALAQSQTNATEGVGLLTVADGALSQVTNLLNRAVTLATEASNGTLNSSQDSAANSEYQSILSEINNIGTTTTYNQQAVFGSASPVNIYTGDSSAQGSAMDALNIRTLSSANLGDTAGVMSYSNGQSNVFVNLSSGGNNAAVTDSLGAESATTTINVSYLTKGVNGSSVSASAPISVGAGTTYSNNAQGLINAINNSGLGLTATFATAAQSGSAAVTAAQAAGGAGTDTGIEISANGIGSNGAGSNGVGVVGALSLATGDTLGGTLSIVGSDGASHNVTLGTTNSTDTLQNLMSTINSAGYGVTASLQGQTQLTFTSADSGVSVTGTNLTQNTAPSVPQNIMVTNSGLGSLTVGSAADTLTGTLSLTSGVTGLTTQLTLGTSTGSNKTDTLANLAQTINNGGYGITAKITNGTTLTFTNGSGNVNPAAVSGSNIQDVAAPSVNQGNTLGSLSVANAGDTLGVGTLNLTSGNGVVEAGLTLGSVANGTDTLSNLANTINGLGYGITATLDKTGTALTFTQSSGSGTAAVGGTNIVDNTFTTVQNPISISIGQTLGAITLQQAGDTISGGTLNITSSTGKTSTLVLGSGVNTLANIVTAFTSNASYNNLGIAASLSSDGKTISFTGTGQAAITESDTNAGNNPVDTIGVHSPVTQVVAGTGSSLGTLTVSSASEGLKSGTLTINQGSDGKTATLALGTSTGGLGVTTDTLADLAATINGTKAYGITATVSQDGTSINFTATGGVSNTYTPSISSNPISQRPTVALGSNLGSLTAGAATDTFTGSFTIGQGNNGGALTTMNFSGKNLTAIADQINGDAAYGVTATLNQTAIVGTAGTQAIGTVLTFTQTPGATSTASITNNGAIQDTAAPTAVGTDTVTAPSVGVNIGTLTVTGANNTLNGTLTLTEGVDGNATQTPYTVTGQTLQQVANSFNQPDGANSNLGITAALSVGNTVLTFTQTTGDAGTAAVTGSVAETAPATPLNITVATGTMLNTITVANSGDLVTGSFNYTKGNGITTGTYSATAVNAGGETLAQIAADFNSGIAGGALQNYNAAAFGITATVSQDGKTLTFSQNLGDNATNTGSASITTDATTELSDNIASSTSNQVFDSSGAGNMVNTLTVGAVTDQLTGTLNITEGADVNNTTSTYNLAGKTLSEVAADFTTGDQKGLGIAVALNAAGTALTFTQAAGAVSKASVTAATSIVDTQLPGTPTPISVTTVNADLGTLKVNASTDLLSGTITGVKGDGTTAYSVNLGNGNTGGTAYTLTSLAAAFNSVNGAYHSYGITANLNAANTGLTFQATTGDTGAPTVASTGYTDATTSAITPTITPPVIGGGTVATFTMNNSADVLGGTLNITEAGAAQTAKSIVLGTVGAANQSTDNIADLAASFNNAGGANNGLGITATITSTAGGNNNTITLTSAAGSAGQLAAVNLTGTSIYTADSATTSIVHSTPTTSIGSITANSTTDTISGNLYITSNIAAAAPTTTTGGNTTFVTNLAPDKLAGTLELYASAQNAVAGTIFGGTSTTVGTITVANVNNLLSGVLTVTRTDGGTDAVTLGTAGKTDTLANLAAYFTTGLGATDGIVASGGGTTTVTLTGSGSTAFAGGAALKQQTATTITLGTAGSTDTVANLLASFAVGGANHSANITATASGVTGIVFGGTSATTIGGSSLAAYTTSTIAYSGTIAGLQTLINGADKAQGVTANVSNGGKTINFADNGLGTQAAILSGSLTQQGVGLNVSDTENNAVAPTTENTLTVSAANETLSGTITVANGSGGSVAHVLAGQTIAQIMANFNNSAGAQNNWSGEGVTASISGNTLTLSQTTPYGAQPNVTSTGLTDTRPASSVDINVASGTMLDTLNVNNKSDMLSGSLNLTSGITGVAAAPLKLGMAGTTDTLANLASTINIGNYGITASLNAAQTQLTFTQNSGDGFTASVGGTSVTDTMNTSLASSNSLGTLTVSSTSDKLTGTLTGVEGDGKTAYTPISLTGQTLQQLAATIDNADAAYGIVASLNQTAEMVNGTNQAAGTVLTFSANSADSGAPTIGNQGNISDVTPAGQTSITMTNQPTASQNYYSLGISGSVTDTSTSATVGGKTTYGGTANVGIATDHNGTGGTATISYSDAAGVSLSSTDLTNQTDAQATLTALSKAITDVAAQDGYIGAQINTLNAVSQVLSTQAENVTAAQNAVQATDYAAATSNMSKYEILSQTGISALAQANSMQQEVTKLLQ